MQVLWNPKAEKQWRKIGDRKVQGRILGAVDTLECWPDCAQVKTLTNHQYGYRLRAGNWRILFDLIDSVPNIIRIEEVRKRDERTY